MSQRRCSRGHYAQRIQDPGRAPVSESWTCNLRSWRLVSRHRHQPERTQANIQGGSSSKYPANPSDTVRYELEEHDFAETKHVN